MIALQKWSFSVGQVVMRYSVVLFFIVFGLAKFTPAEALSIEPLLKHSPFLFWLPAIADRQTASDVIGVIEIALALMVAARPFAPKVSAIGSFGTAVALVTTLSFLVTTPAIDPALASFIVKDLTLLGVMIWSGGEALGAVRSRTSARLALA